MKVRSGFVSNSSSSSFVCSVCNTVETGYDGQYDFDVSQCYDGHEWCSEHDIDFTTEDKQRILLVDNDFLSSHSDEKVGFIKSGSVELIDDVFKEYEVQCTGYGEVPKTMCPVCSLASISSNDVLAWILKDSSKTLQEVELEIRSRFSSLEELREGLKS